MLWGSQNINQVLNEEKIREQLYEPVFMHVLKSVNNSSPFTSNGMWYNWDMLTEVQAGWRIISTEWSVDAWAVQFKTVTDLQTAEHNGQSWVFAVSSNVKELLNESCSS